MFGKNLKRKPEKGDGKKLFVQEMFSTLQGECYLAGVPAVFVRLGGCNLACKFCDTEFESFKEISVEKIIEKTEKLAKNKRGKRVKNLVVITGGEPFRQPIEYLCKQLIKAKFKVQIETNGTIFRDLPKAVEVVCSPKAKAKIHGDLLPRINAFKFIISKNFDGYKNIWDAGQSASSAPVYIQPMDEYNARKNKANLECCKKLALEEGYYLSLQTHKIIGLD
jgi:organic radical activating enzyme